MNKEGVWLISDYHGVLATEKKGQAKNTQLVDHPVTDEFLLLLDNLSLHPEIFTYQKFLKEVFAGSEHWSLNLQEPGFGFRQSLAERILSIGSDKLNKRFFDPFEIRDETIEGLKLFWENSIDITICSGIPFNARGGFLNQINPILDYLHPSLPAILRPTDLLDFGRTQRLALRFRNLFIENHYPTTTGSYVKLGFGRSLQRYSGKDIQIAAIEDDTYVAKCLSRALGIKVYMPISQAEAYSQSHLKKLLLPDSLQNIPDNIVFEYSFSDIYEDLKHG